MGGVYLDGEIAHLKSLGITLVVSLLDELNTQALGLMLEDMVCRSHDVAFIHTPVRDRSAPSAGAAADSVRGSGASSPDEVPSTKFSFLNW